MGLLNKFFKPGESREEAPMSTRVQDLDSAADPPKTDVQRGNKRREMVQVALRETMRRHAVPGDWLELRMLPVITSSGRNGIHLQLVVKQGQGSMLYYIPSFQSAFMAEIEKFEPRAWDWLLSISWQFAGITSTDPGELPVAASAPMPLQAKAAGTTIQPDVDLTMPPEGTEEEIEQDLRALFAIRDAALRRPSGAGKADFEPTQPWVDGKPKS